MRSALCFLQCNVTSNKWSVFTHCHLQLYYIPHTVRKLGYCHSHAVLVHTFINHGHYMAQPKIYKCVQDTFVSSSCGWLSKYLGIHEHYSMYVTDSGHTCTFDLVFALIKKILKKISKSLIILKCWSLRAWRKLKIIS